GDLVTTKIAVSVVLGDCTSNFNRTSPLAADVGISICNLNKDMSLAGTVPLSIDTPEKGLGSVDGVRQVILSQKPLYAHPAGSSTSGFTILQVYVQSSVLIFSISLCTSIKSPSTPLVV